MLNSPERNGFTPVIKLTEHDLKDVVVPVSIIDEICRLNTPDEILDREIFNPPEIIRPASVSTSDELFARRAQIRVLTLVPEKTREMYDHYHGHAKDEEGRQKQQLALAREVETYFNCNNNFAFVPNYYPYNLPLHVYQYIAWMKNMDTPRRDTAEFIAKCLNKLEIQTDNVIVFERSLKTTVQRVRGSFPVYRHVHVWIRED